MKELLIIAPYYRFPDEGANGRHRYLSERLSAEGIPVRVVTSSFLHLKKIQRDTNNLHLEQYPYQIKLINEPGYKKNIAIRRIYSHHRFAHNLKVYLRQLDDNIGAVYCAIPTPDAAIIAGQFAKERGIPFIIDIQDLWPESMRMAIDIPILSSLVFYPLKLLSEKAYSMADIIIAVSGSFTKRAQEVNHQAQVLPVYIGTDLPKFDRLATDNIGSIEKQADEFWVTYIGMLGNSYDIETLMLAIKQLRDKGYSNIKLKIIGDGPLKMQFESFALATGLDVDFTGYLDYGVMAAYLKKSDLAVNPIRKKSASSIINKIGDYAASGLPIVNGSLNNELQALIKDWQAGINYLPEDPTSLSNAIEQLYLNHELRETVGFNSRALAEERFDRANSYTQIIELIRTML